MQQGAQLCFNGNFLVDRSEYPPLASRVLTSSGVAALPIRRDAYAQDGAQGHLSSEGLGGDPKHRGAIRPKPQCKLSRMSQLLTIYTNPRLQAILSALVHFNCIIRGAAWAAAEEIPSFPSRNRPRQRAGDDDPVVAGEHPGEGLAVTLRQRLPQPPLLLPASPASILACLVPASPA
jgi:hypothetical protein